MVDANRDAQKDAAGLPHMAPGDQMPYRTPRGPLVGGHRTGLHIAQVLAVVLMVVLFVAIAYMSHWQWG
jgi:hypothetical protein